MVSITRILEGPSSLFAVYDLSFIFAGPGKLLPQSDLLVALADQLLVQVPGVSGQQRLNHQLARMRGLVLHNR